MNEDEFSDMLLHLIILYYKKTWDEDTEKELKSKFPFLFDSDDYFLAWKMSSIASIPGVDAVVSTFEKVLSDLDSETIGESGENAKNESEMDEDEESPLVITITDSEDEVEIEQCELAMESNLVNGFAPSVIQNSDSSGSEQGLLSLSDSENEEIGKNNGMKSLEIFTNNNSNNNAKNGGDNISNISREMHLMYCDGCTEECLHYIDAPTPTHQAGSSSVSENNNNNGFTPQIVSQNQVQEHERQKIDDSLNGHDKEKQKSNDLSSVHDNERENQRKKSDYRAIPIEHATTATFPLLPPTQRLSVIRYADSNGQVTFPSLPDRVAELFGNIPGPSRNLTVATAQIMPDIPNFGPKNPYIKEIVITKDWVFPDNLVGPGKVQDAGRSNPHQVAADPQNTQVFIGPDGKLQEAKDPNLVELDDDDVQIIDDSKCGNCHEPFRPKTESPKSRRSDPNALTAACDKCDRKFINNFGLKRHYVRHGDKNYCCRHAGCTMRFFTRAELGSHERVHATIKPYYCKYCSKEYSQSGRFFKHLRDVHNKNDACIKCVKDTQYNNIRRSVRQLEDSTSGIDFSVRARGRPRTRGRPSSLVGSPKHNSTVSRGAVTISEIPSHGLQNYRNYAGNVKLSFAGTINQSTGEVSPPNYNQFGFIGSENSLSNFSRASNAFDDGNHWINNGQALQREQLRKNNSNGCGNMTPEVSFWDGFNNLLPSFNNSTVRPNIGIEQPRPTQGAVTQNIRIEQFRSTQGTVNQNVRIEQSRPIQGTVNRILRTNNNSTYGYERSRWGRAPTPWPITSQMQASSPSPCPTPASMPELQNLHQVQQAMLWNSRLQNELQAQQLGFKTFNPYFNN